MLKFKHKPGPINKIAAIRELRDITYPRLGLRDAKEAVEAAIETSGSIKVEGEYFTYASTSISELVYIAPVDPAQEIKAALKDPLQVAIANEKYSVAKALLDVIESL